MNYKTCNDCALDRYCGIDSEACERFKDRHLYPAQEIIRGADVEYDIGDKVWFAECHPCGWHMNPNQSIVRSVVVALAEVGLTVSYWLVYHDIAGLELAEKHKSAEVFSSYEEGELWCKKMNESEGKN